MNSLMYKVLFFMNVIESDPIEGKYIIQTLKYILLSSTSIFHEKLDELF